MCMCVYSCVNQVCETKSESLELSSLADASYTESCMSGVRKLYEILLFDFYIVAPFLFILQSDVNRRFMINYSANYSNSRHSFASFFCRFILLSHSLNRIELFF